MKARTNLFSVIVLGLVFMVSHTGFGLEYHIIDLGTLGGSKGHATCINENNQIVGLALTSSGEKHAFLYENGQMTDLGTLGGNMSMAHGINDYGQIVGESINKDGQIHAFLYEDNVMQDLGTLGGNYSRACEINNLGQIAGNSRLVNSNTYHAFLYENGQMIPLAKFCGHSGAYSINDLGQIVGYSYISGSANHAVLWEDGNIYDLGTTEGFLRSNALAINDRGQIVGHSNNLFKGKYHATLFDPTGEGNNIKLGTLGGAWSATTSVNNNGRMVGYADTASGKRRATIFDPTGAGNNIDLGTLGGNNSLAHYINDAGWIVGYAETAEGEEHAALWVPGPAGVAVFYIQHAIAEKLEALERIDAALEKDWEAYEALEQLLETGDYGDLNYADIVKAKQKIYSAIQHQEQSKKTLEKSIEKLEDALAALSSELEPGSGQ